MRNQNHDVSFQKLVQLIGYIDVVTGVIGGLIASHVIRKAIRKHVGGYKDSISYELYCTILVCHLIEAIFGCVLVLAAQKKEGWILLLWLIVTSITGLFTFFPKRIIGMYYVYNFAKELKKNSELNQSNQNSSERNSTNTNVIQTISGNLDYNRYCCHEYDPQVQPPPYELVVGLECAIEEMQIFYDYEPTPPKYEDVTENDRLVLINKVK